MGQAAALALAAGVVQGEGLYRATGLQSALLLVLGGPRATAGPALAPAQPTTP